MVSKNKTLLPFSLYEELENLDKLNSEEMKSFLLSLRKYCDSSGKSYSKICQELDIEEPKWSGKLSPKQVQALDKATAKHWSWGEASEWEVTENGIVNVKGSIDLNRDNIFSDEKGFIGIKFGKIEGDFDCSNIGLDKLDGCPEEITGNFRCRRNPITSLIGGPKKVNGNYELNSSRWLESLEGAPEEIRKEFNVSDCGLESLAGSPKIVGNFLCQGTNIIDLIGGPEKITGRGFYADNCPLLSSLIGAPEIVKSDTNRFQAYSFKNCPNLYSLEGIPLETKPPAIYLEKNAFRPMILRRAFEVAAKTGSWIVGYMSMFTDPDFLRTGKAPKDPIREKLKPENIKKEIETNGEKFVVGLKSIWKDPRIKKLLKDVDIPEETKFEGDLLSTLDDIGL